MRFNPPPGWQVPDNFVPPQGWQPDPSWPMAPAGWQFWVDEPTQAGSYDPATNYNPAAGYTPGAASYPGAPSYSGEQPQASVAQPLDALVAQRKQGRNQMLTGLAMVVATVVIFLAADRLFYVFAIFGVVSAFAGLLGYIRADRKLRAVSPAANFGAGDMPSITKTPEHLRKDDGTMPGQWKV